MLERYDGWANRHWKWFVLAGWLVLSITFLVNKWGVIHGFGFGDTDDNLRLVQVRDWLNGQPFDGRDVAKLRAVAPQLAVAIDRAILKERAGELRQLSVTDALTGLLNRRYLEERLTEEVLRSNRYGYPMCYIMLDVDHFKSYNDEFGHPAGDETLRLVAHLLKDTLRAADVAARYGGEEFAVLLPQTTSEVALVIAERIRQNIERTEFPHRRVTVSIGVSSCHSEFCTTTELVAEADKALYDSKRQGRNRVTVFGDQNIGAADPE